MSLPLVLSLFSTNHNTTPHQNVQKVVAKVVSQDLFIQLIGYQKEPGTCYSSIPSSQSHISCLCDMALIYLAMYSLSAKWAMQWEVSLR